MFRDLVLAIFREATAPAGKLTPGPRVKLTDYRRTLRARKAPLRTHRVKLSALIVLAIIASALGLAIGIATAATQKPEEPAAGIVQSWNEAVSTLELEDQNFHELLDSYKRNPPGRVLLTEDVRAAQQKRRLRLIASIVASHEERIRAMQRLAKFEEALP